ncbi:MAG: nucleotidyl transferase AbiEii/AbiGii toxin family protein, partial [Terriglobales bacterium]
MPDAKHYTNARNFRQALDERLKNIARQENVSINDLHRQVVFDRFLARLDPARFVLTGGYSLELRLPKSRSTTDIDLYIRDQQLLSANEDEQKQAILHALRQQAENETTDLFSFEIERITGKLHGPKAGGIRCLVIARIDN